MTIQDKKARMAVIVADWQASGLSQLEYSQLHNFKVGTLRCKHSPLKFILVLILIAS